MLSIIQQTHGKIESLWNLSAKKEIYMLHVIPVDTLAFDSYLQLRFSSACQT